MSDKLIPEWMEPYRPMIRWTEGHQIEVMLSNDGPTIPLWRSMCVTAQIQLLHDLHNEGLLTPTKENQ